MIGFSFAYADCGTGGLLDKALAGTGIERIPGAHCYEFYAGSEVFHRLADEEPGSFYLTDFLVRHFERLVVRGLGLDRQPQLKSGDILPTTKGWSTSPRQNQKSWQSMARQQAEFLGLEYCYRFHGDEPLSLALKPMLAEE